MTMLIGYQTSDGNWAHFEYANVSKETNDLLLGCIMDFRDRQVPYTMIPLPG